MGVLERRNDALATDPEGQEGWTSISADLGGPGPRGEGQGRRPTHLPNFPIFGGSAMFSLEQADPGKSSTDWLETREAKDIHA